MGTSTVRYGIDLRYCDRGKTRAGRRYWLFAVTVTAVCLLLLAAAGGGLNLPPLGSNAEEFDDVVRDRSIVSSSATTVRRPHTIAARKLLDVERIESYGTLCFDALMLSGLGRCI
eukprot:CAMPEP_0118937698 /NCGR_PEP_ID=MMETSP1169-20130426/23547_1 /TAXON_ID=36882 /ORGANISM="Pyramimonas obovata, Strain CCMP722" /LENGTH=114 /DNA_ID=CAMNT_0006881417 /DNA_START=90 /DNA_END=434 /DNA_ORIENTATION=-